MICERFLFTLSAIISLLKVRFVADLHALGVQIGVGVFAGLEYTKGIKLEKYIDLFEEYANEFLRRFIECVTGTRGSTEHLHLLLSKYSLI